MSASAVVTAKLPCAGVCQKRSIFQLFHDCRKRNFFEFVEIDELYILVDNPIDFFENFLVAPVLIFVSAPSCSCLIGSEFSIDHGMKS